MICWDRHPKAGNATKIWAGIGPNGEEFRIKLVRRAGARKAHACKLSGDLLAEPVRFIRVEDAKRYAGDLFPPGFRRATWPAHPWEGQSERW
jgi:hypothetical protein